jgi:hypothetical protein
MISNVKDLIEVDQFNMRSAVASLLSELVRVGYQAREKDYTFVIEHSLEYGYEKQYNGHWKGNTQIRESLNRVAIECHASAHKMISDSVVNFLESHNPLDVKKDWYYRDLKILLQNLLLNIHCAAKYAKRFGESLEKMNKLSH